MPGMAPGIVDSAEFSKVWQRACGSSQKPAPGDRRRNMKLSVEKDSAGQGEHSLRVLGSV